MRLTPAQIDTTKSTATAVLGEGVQVWLYGSRLDDQRRGGDVDLLVQTARKARVMARTPPSRPGLAPADRFQPSDLDRQRPRPWRARGMAATHLRVIFSVARRQ